MIKVKHIGKKSKLSLFIIQSGTIILFNSLVIFLYSRERQLKRKITNILFVNQACVDLFNGLIMVPILILLMYYYHKSLYNIFQTCFSVSLLSSLLSLTLLAFERYFAVSKPFIHRQIFTKGRIKYAIISVWISSMLISMVPPQTWIHVTTAMAKAKMIQNFVYFLWAFTAVSFTIIVSLYVGTLRIAQQFIKRQLERLADNSMTTERKDFLTIHRKEMRVTKLFIAFNAAFVVTYIPTLIINVFDFVGLYYAEVYLISDIVGLFYVANSVLNPLLTLYLKEDYFCALKRLLRKRQS